MVRIPAFHRRGPGSIPGVGKIFSKAITLKSNLVQGLGNYYPGGIRAQTFSNF